MKKLTTLLMVSVVMATGVMADFEDGHKYYSKHIWNECGMNGAVFSSEHTQDEWEAIHEAGGVAKEIEKICEIKVEEKYIKDLYEFFMEYASDSGQIPIC